MKTYFLVAMIGYAVLVPGVVHADPASKTTAQLHSGIPGGAVSGHQPVSSPPAVAAPGGLVGNKVAGNPAVRPPGAVPLTGASSRNAGNRGPSAAVIGGPANPAKNAAAISGTSARPAKNTVVINGTGLNHKH